MAKGDQGRPVSSRAAISGARLGAARPPAPVLSVRHLAVEVATSDGPRRAVDGISYDLFPGETLGIVGESGSGKTMAALAILGLLPGVARIAAGSISFEGRDLRRLPNRQLRSIRGKDVAFIFQDPMTSLNPVRTVGSQIAEIVRIHQPATGRAALRRRGMELLELVGIPDAAARHDQYPHELSGGMRQRVMIAMAIANDPKLLIADEPTTALDVTVQAQVIDVLRTAKRVTGAAMIFISHDLGLVAEFADQVAVMYAGRFVETGGVRDIFAGPRHPYTVGLLAGLPRLDADVGRLMPIPGHPPELARRPTGCAFHPRCPLARGRRECSEQVPDMREAGSRGHRAACHFVAEVPKLARPRPAPPVGRSGQ